jgi:hypothetical protein
MKAKTIVAQEAERAAEPVVEPLLSGLTPLPATPSLPVSRRTTFAEADRFRCGAGARRPRRGIPGQTYH